MPNRRRGSENLHQPEFAEKDTRLMGNGGKERLQTREKDDEREKRGVEAVWEMEIMMGAAILTLWLAAHIVLGWAIGTVIYLWYRRWH